MHSYRSPEHERATAEALARDLPAAYVSLSSDVFPQIKEFERVCTTVVNAYVGPALDRYLQRGAGGGSIAHVDTGGVLHVGPASAGADPGPACYARGGTSPTVTDANPVLGFLDPRRFLGGRQRLDTKESGSSRSVAASIHGALRYCRSGVRPAST